MKNHISSVLLGILVIASSCNKDSKSDNRVKDADGNVYNTVKIGSQTWMVENLRTTKYNDGTPIPAVSENSKWSELLTDGYCWYDDDSDLYAETYGALYNWFVIGSGKLAPEGWHVATDEDWNTLVSFLGGVEMAGGKLKESGTSHWISPNTSATDDYGFTALPAGYRAMDGTFNDLQISGDWWVATQINSGNAWFRGIGFNQPNISRIGFSKRYAFSVRCVKSVD